MNNTIESCVRCKCGKPAIMMIALPATTSGTPESHIEVCDEHKQQLFDDWERHAGRSTNTLVILPIPSMAYERWAEGTRT